MWTNNLQLVAVLPLATFQRYDYLPRNGLGLGDMFLPRDATQARTVPSLVVCVFVCHLHEFYQNE